ncbi:hypothetical protein [uncultured Nostoc sp.]|uniref:hypothetical protein n=1 Tax=uncultured Nostoc sp. TaxID=340711 RepID=UPI0035CC7FAA
MELKELGQFDDLSEEELVGAFGGLTSTNDKVAQPLYGAVVSPPPKDCAKPPIKWIPRPCPKPLPQPQPLYGKVIGSPVQASYGAVVQPEVQ